MMINIFKFSPIKNYILFNFAKYIYNNIPKDDWIKLCFEQENKSGLTVQQCFKYFGYPIILPECKFEHIEKSKIHPNIYY